MEQHLAVGQDVTAEDDPVVEVRVDRGIVVRGLEVHVDRGIVVRDCSANVEDQAEHWRKHCKMLSKQVK